MYSYIKGTVITKSENLFILENNGIGYEIVASTNTISDLQYDKEVCIYTYMQVKEDGITLFGFLSYEEKDLFLKLISVSGVGGKTAIQILSGARLSDIISGIMNGDLKMLKGIKGIGKKTAELICVSLREKIADMGYTSNNESLPNDVVSVNQDIVNDTCEALMGLGLKRIDAMKLIKKQYTGTETLEELISKCLKNK